jgi:hypothetical protein
MINKPTSGRVDNVPIELTEMLLQPDHDDDDNGSEDVDDSTGSTTL